jgi:hypothetical protein
MKRLILSVLAIGVLAGFSGCSTRLGNMTVVSTNNVGGLSAKVSEAQRTEGQSCIYTAIIFPFGDFQNRLQIATDNAIDNGHKAGLQGDVIVNAKIDITHWYIPLIYGQNCMVVKGDLIDMSNSMK